jgi:hypothetical protein
MIRPKQELNDALVRLASNRDFNDFVKHIESSLAEQQDANIDLSGEEGERGKGKAWELREILAFIKAAPQQVQNRESRLSAPTQRRPL